MKLKPNLQSTDSELKGTDLKYKGLKVKQKCMECGKSMECPEKYAFEA